ncbi:MAG TPA: alpha/beta hydrolase-fold protein [Candidatus Eisenbacteria bacterium]|nr:alpha/beta hydrolase-fold protein [Candidatus Eisenbacteria bacterium]
MGRAGAGRKLRRLAAFVVIVLLACVALAVRARARTAPAIPHGRLGFAWIPSPALHQLRSARVYLPPSYASSPQRRYPTIYLLHGWPGGDGNWSGHGRAAVTLDTLIARHRIPEVIAVMPNGNGVGLLGRSLYLNSYDGKYRMEDYIVHDVVTWADSALRTLPDPAHRALIGLSDGGTAALNLCFKHPDVFGACGGHSGQYHLKHDSGLRRILGAEPGARALLDANSPTVYAARIADQLRHLVIYFDCGRHDAEARYAVELDARLDSLAVPHTFHLFPGRHGWGYWKLHLRDSLIAVTRHMWDTPRAAATPADTSDGTR